MAKAGQKVLGDDDAAGIPSLVPGVESSKLWNGLGIDHAYWVYYCCTPLRWRREITSLTMFHKLLHSRPEPLNECLFQYASATSACSRRKPFQLLLPHTRTTRYRESFFYRSALLWNSLPHDTQSLKNSKSFRNALENHYKSYKCTTTQNFTYHSPLPFLSLQIVCTHIPNCVTSHATIFLQPLDGDPLDQGSSLLGNP